MIRVWGLNRTRNHDTDGCDPDWARRTDIPLALVMAWIAALTLTTVGLVAFQHLYG